jgi:hypothetical protein
MRILGKEVGKVWTGFRWQALVNTAMNFRVHDWLRLSASQIGANFKLGVIRMR